MADAFRFWSHLSGTPYEIETAGTILFLEDIATKPFQIDRMLMQLKLAGKLDDVKGIIFGEMIDCVQTANQDYTLQEVITRIVGDVGNTDRLRRPLRSCVDAKHHSPIRREGEIKSRQQHGSPANSGSRSHAVVFSFVYLSVLSGD